MSKNAGPPHCFTFDFNAYELEEVENLQIACHATLDDPDRIDRMRKLRYQREIGIWLDRQFADPDDDFVAFLAKQIHGGLRTKSVLETFKGIIPGALRAKRNRAIGDRLRRAMAEETEQPAERPEERPETTEAPRAKRVRAHLTVTLNGTRYSTSERGWDGTAVLRTVLEKLWESPEGQEAVRKATPENGYLREQAESFGTSAKPARIQPDGPWISTNMSQATRADLLAAVREGLPEEQQAEFTWEVRPAASEAENGE